VAGYDRGAALCCRWMADRYLPKMEIDAQTYSVRADGQLLTCEAAVSLPMTQRYFLF